MSAPVFEVRDFNVRFATHDGEVHAVRNASFSIRESECLAVVGESGSGKSQLFLATLGLLTQNGKASGSVKFRDREILGLQETKLNALRGSKITMIFQDPLTSLTPHLTIGTQIIETLRTHQRLSRGEAEKRAVEILDLVRVPEAKRRLTQFPHELSGGMRQRVMIAMATVCGPDLLIADEPTTALDVTVQAQILEIMRDLKTELKTAIVLISHDMGVIAGAADRVLVMKEGDIVEAGPVDDIFYQPQNPYTKMLLSAMPRIDKPERKTTPQIPGARSALLQVENLKVFYPVNLGGFPFPDIKPLRAVDGVSFNLRQGETLGIVGESGCGKSTLARAIIKLLPETAGLVVWCGRNLGAMEENDIRKLRKDFQIVFQDPMESLDPRMTIGESIAEPLKLLRPDMSAETVRREVREMMARVGLEPSWINRYPHEFSGGQNQRVGIARAMIVRPKLVICDEAVSALDVSIRSQIIDLIINLQAEFGMSIIFISHDLSVVRQISHRVMVLYLGRVVEFAGSDEIYEDPRHPYTRALISAIPIPDPKAERAKPRIQFAGDLPSPLDTRAALSFLKSKMIDNPDAEQYQPRLLEVSPSHFVAEHDGL